MLRKMFYDFLDKVRPNAAHQALATLEQKGVLKALVTQNIDDLHRAAGSQTVHEFHGNYRRLTCLACHAHYGAAQVNLAEVPPTCRMCGGVLKPDIIFFGEAIPEPARTDSFDAADACDVILVVGTSGEVMPACLIPRVAKEHGATVIEVNKAPSAFTDTITDVFLEGPAGEVLTRLLSELGLP
jgi:NAD-dependent deacetylase